jgi:hypothetical protein
MNSIVSLVGEEKTGKTSLAMTAPKPIFHMDFDVGGFNRASWRFQEELRSGQIISTSYHAPQQADPVSVTALKSAIKMRQNSAGIRPSRTGALVGLTELWYDRFLTDYIKALEDPQIRTIVLDSFTMVWSLCHGSLLQEKQQRQKQGDQLREQLLQIEYGQANERMRSIVFAARETNKNLIVVHHTDDKYGQQLNDRGQVESIIVGKTHGGWKHIRPLVDLEIWTEISQVRGTVPAKRVPTARIELSGLHMDAVGLRFEDPNWDNIFQMIKVLRGEVEVGASP